MSSEHKENIICVTRKNDRIMAIRMIIGETIINIICVYAPQTGCEEEEKVEFWQDLDALWTEISDDKRTLIADDLNGHIGMKNFAIERIHGGYGSGTLNNDSKRVIDFAMAHDLAILNTFFKKNDYITCENGGQETQLDYILYKRNNMNEVKNCIVIKGEGVSKQHHLVVGELKIKCRKKGKRQSTPKIKWWNFKFHTIYHLAVLNEHLAHVHRSPRQLNGWFGSVVSRQELGQQQYSYFVVLWSIFTFGVLVKTFKWRYNTL